MNSNTLDFHARALASPTRGFAHLLATLDRRLHEMPPTLELTQDAFAGHLTLEMLDCSLDALVSDLDFEGLALNCFGRIRHGRVDMPDTTGRRNWKAPS